MTQRYCHRCPAMSSGLSVLTPVWGCGLMSRDRSFFKEMGYIGPISNHVDYMVRDLNREARREDEKGERTGDNIKILSIILKLVFSYLLPWRNINQIPPFPKSLRKLVQEAFHVNHHFMSVVVIS